MVVNRGLSTGVTLPIHTVCIWRSSAVSVTWLFSPIGQLLSQRWSSELKDQGYDNALPVSDYYTPHGAVIDEYGTVVGWWLAGEKLRKFGEKWAPVPLHLSPSGKLLLDLASKVILGFRSCQDPWPYFCFSKTCLFWNGTSCFTRGSGRN
jgi:hypothetical protein